MAFCASCGNQVDDGVKFCPTCGTNMTGKPAKPASPKKLAKEENQTGELQADPKEAELYKGLAIVSYLGFEFIIPLLTGDYKKSEFLKFHTNQGLVLFIASVALWIAMSILGALLAAIHLWALIPLISTVVWVGILAFIILGIINAVKGRMRPLPLIGKFTLIK